MSGEREHKAPQRSPNTCLVTRLCVCAFPPLDPINAALSFRMLSGGAEERASALGLPATAWGNVIGGGESQNCAVTAYYYY